MEEKFGKLKMKRTEPSHVFPGHYEIFVPGIQESVITVWDADGFDSKACAEKIVSALSKVVE